MSDSELSEFERARARKLAQTLRDKLEQYALIETTEEQAAEIRDLQDQLRAMGFLIRWTMNIRLETGTVNVVVELYGPFRKPADEPPKL